MLRKKSARVAKTLARRINTGNILDKHKTTTALTIYGASVGLIAGTLFHETQSMTIPIIGSAGVIASKPIHNLLKNFSTRLKSKTVGKLFGKPLLAEQVVKNIKDPKIKSVLYLIANARSTEEKTELRKYIIGEPTDKEVIVRIARKAIKQQKDVLSKQLYYEIRGERGIPTRKLNSTSAKIKHALNQKIITTNEEYREAITRSSLPYAISLTMDTFKIHNNTTRKQIFTAIKNQFGRIKQKMQFNPDINPRELTQDIKVQQFARDLGIALKNAFTDEKASTTFLTHFMHTNFRIMQYLHEEILIQTNSEHLMQIIKETK